MAIKRHAISRPVFLITLTLIAWGLISLVLALLPVVITMDNQVIELTSTIAFGSVALWAVIAFPTQMFLLFRKKKRDAPKGVS